MHGDFQGDNSTISSQGSSPVSQSYTGHTAAPPRQAAATTQSSSSDRLGSAAPETEADDIDDVESVLRGIAQLSNQLNRLEMDVPHAADGASHTVPLSVSVPSRSARVEADVVSPKTTSYPKTPKIIPGRSGQPHQHARPSPKATQAKASTSRGAVDALKDLDREMASLAQKKAAVQHLARSFQNYAINTPIYDDEDEDDGFPLR